MDERDRDLLVLMLDSLERAQRWPAEAGPDWTADEKTVAAVAHMIAQLGEWARRLSESARAARPDVPWRDLIGMRNRIYHDYGGLDLLRLEETVVRDLPQLEQAIDAMLTEG